LPEDGLEADGSQFGSQHRRSTTEEIILQANASGGEDGNDEEPESVTRLQTRTMGGSRITKRTRARYDHLHGDVPPSSVWRSLRYPELHREEIRSRGKQFQEIATDQKLHQKLDTPSHSLDTLHQTWKNGMKTTRRTCSKDRSDSIIAPAGAIHLGHPAEHIPRAVLALRTAPLFGLPLLENLAGERTRRLLATEQFLIAKHPLDLGARATHARGIVSGVSFAEFLSLHEASVGAVLVMKELGVCALLKDKPIAHDENLINVFDGREPVSDCDRCATLLKGG
jgi:hypothetical protein